MTSVPNRVAAELLRFVAPGILHGLGNSLFAIRGHAQLLRGSENEVGRSRAAILKASEKSLRGLDVLRFLAAEAEGHSSSQAGILLHRLCDFVRIPLSEHGLRLTFEHKSSQTPMSVEGTALCQCVVELLRQLVCSLPASYEGCAIVDLVAQRKRSVAIEVQLRSSPSLLPFPIDFEGAVERMRPLLAYHDVTVEIRPESRRVRLKVPAITLRPMPARPAASPASPQVVES